MSDSNLGIKYVPGVGMVFPNLNNMVYGSPEWQADTDAYLQEQEDFRNTHYWHADRDYIDGANRIFGEAPVNDFTPSFGDGPQDSWLAALRDRQRERKKGTYDGVGWFEKALSTADQTHRANVINRNNIIEDMWRHGYSQQQIMDHVQGKTNALENGPDYADYFRYLKSDAPSNSAAGMLSGNMLSEPEEWMKNYFKFNHDDVRSNAPTNNPFGNIKGIFGSAEKMPEREPNVMNKPKERGPVWGPGGSRGMLSSESQAMRQAIADNLEKKLLG